LLPKQLELGRAARTLERVLFLGGIRFAESVLHQAMESLLAAFPEPLRPAVALILDQLPLQFFVSQLPLYRHVDALYKTHQRLIDGNPAALPKQ
jgi:hypothetical protein